MKINPALLIFIFLVGCNLSNENDKPSDLGYKNETQKLFVSDLRSNFGFGSSISINDDLLLVSTEPVLVDEDNYRSGEIYAFTRDGNNSWKMQDSLNINSSDFEKSSANLLAPIKLRWSIDHTNEVIVVSSVENGIYIFELDNNNQGWSEAKKIPSESAKESSNFGISVRIDSSILVIGDSSKGDASHTTNGTVYIYEQNEGGESNWGLIKSLTASDGQDGDIFGHSVAISKDIIVVGAKGDDSGAGAAYIFERDEGGENNWGEVKKLIHPNPEQRDSFGDVVSIDNETIVIGAFGIDSEWGQNTGAVYLYERNDELDKSWRLVKVLIASDPNEFEGFGATVEIDNDAIVIGTGTLFSNSNKAYVFSRNEGGNDNWGEAEILMPSGLDSSNRFSAFGFSNEMVAVSSGNEGKNEGSVYIFELEAP